MDLEPAQRTAAKAAGFLYLMTMVTAMFAEFYARAQAIVPGDAVQTARNIAASEWLFRLGTLSDLITFAAVLPLVVALYVVLKPVNPYLALLALAWRLVECAILALVMLNDFVALRLLGTAPYLHAFDAAQLQALARVFLGGVHADGYGIGMLFFGLGSTLFAWLWLRSRYIPRLLAGWGIFASLTVVIVTLLLMVAPGIAPALGAMYFIPIFLFEVILGFWLLVRGIREPGTA